MTSFLEDTAISVASELTSFDESTVRDAYAQQPKDGDVIVALMIISIIIGAARLYLDHIKDMECWKKHFKNPTWIQRISLRRKVSQEIRARMLPPDMSVDSERITNAMLKKVRELSDDQAIALWLETKGEG
jgi:hypothetical protein